MPTYNFDNMRLDEATLIKIGITLLIILVVFTLTKLSQRLVPRFVEEGPRRYRISKTIGRAGTLVAVLTILAEWTGTSDLLTILTVIGAGLAIAMREVLMSFFGWIHIALRSPFKTGDRVEINELRGDVIDVRVLHSTLMEIGGWVDADQSTGRIVHFPNSWVFQHPIRNYTHGFRFIWNEIPLTLTFRSDWEAARELMLELAEVSAEIVEAQAKDEIRQMTREYLIHYSILTPFVYVRIVDNGIRLTLRYLCEARKRRGTAHALTMGILDAFKENGRIELAYPMIGVTEITPPQFGPVAGDEPPSIDQP